MKRLMVLQLGLILTLASSSAFAAGKEDVKKDVKIEKTEDARVLKAQREAQERTAKTSSIVDEAASEERSTQMPAKGSRTPEQQVTMALNKIKALAKSQSLGSHQAEVQKILDSSNIESVKLDLIAKEIKKNASDLIANCEE